MDSVRNGGPQDFVPALASRQCRSRFSIKGKIDRLNGGGTFRFVVVRLSRRQDARQTKPTMTEA
jgi:hypothetical protein